jgi:hypothetical protein
MDRKTGRVVLAKPTGVAALDGTVVVGSTESSADLILGTSDQSPTQHGRIAVAPGALA